MKEKCLPKWPKVSEVVAPQKEEEEEEEVPTQMAKSL